MVNRAEELITQLEVEIAKRDARIAELELEQRRFHDAQFNLKSLYKRAAIALSLDQDNTSWFEIVGDLEKVAALKEQQRGGVVLPDTKHLKSAIDGLPDSYSKDDVIYGWQEALELVERLNPSGDGVNWNAVAGEQKTIIAGLQARLNPPGECVADGYVMVPAVASMDMKNAG